MDVELNDFCLEVNLENFPQASVDYRSYIQQIQKAKVKTSKVLVRLLLNHAKIFLNINYDKFYFFFFPQLLPLFVSCIVDVKRKSSTLNDSFCVFFIFRRWLLLLVNESKIRGLTHESHEIIEFSISFSRWTRIFLRVILRVKVGQFECLWKMLLLPGCICSM